MKTSPKKRKLCRVSDGAVRFDPVRRLEPGQDVRAEAQQPRDVTQDELCLEERFCRHSASCQVAIDAASKTAALVCRRDIGPHSGERPVALTSTGHEAELHSKAGRARRRRGVPERRQESQFRKAAADLGVTPSAISQAVRTLEARVGAALFIRTTRSVGLTEAGERFLSRAKPAFEELVAAGEVVRDLGAGPTGVLRLTVPRAVVPILLEPLIASFCQAFPEVEVEIAASEELVDLAAGGFDAGVRMGQFIAADMVAVRLRRPSPSWSSAAPSIYAGEDGPNASTICVSMLACAFAARTGRSGPGPLSTATSRSRQSSRDR